jgi:hypothetical protein
MTKLILTVIGEGLLLSIGGRAIWLKLKQDHEDWINRND